MNLLVLLAVCFSSSFALESWILETHYQAENCAGPIDSLSYNPTYCVTTPGLDGGSYWKCQDGNKAAQYVCSKSDDCSGDDCTFAFSWNLNECVGGGSVYTCVDQIGKMPSGYYAVDNCVDPNCGGGLVYKTNFYPPNICGPDTYNTDKDWFSYSYCNKDNVVVTKTKCNSDCSKCESQHVHNDYCEDGDHWYCGSDSSIEAKN